MNIKLTKPIFFGILVCLMVMTAGIASAATDRPPVMSSIGSKTVNEGKLLSFTISAKDPDGNKVTYSATGLPKGAKLSATTGKFTWTPASGTAGKYTVKFIATANGKKDSETITITVLSTSAANKIDLAIINGADATIKVAWTKANPKTKVEISKDSVFAVDVPAGKTRDVKIPPGAFYEYVLYEGQWYKVDKGPVTCQLNYKYTVKYWISTSSGNSLHKIPKSEAPKI